MRIALTGSSGTIGRAITSLALARGHSIVGIDRVDPTDALPPENFRFVSAEMSDYDALVAAFEDCDAMIHMAAIPRPFHQPDHVVHNNNVVGSYNALRAAVEHNITRICQASSVNAIGLSYSRSPRFDYFPIDEQHPNYGEEPYALSKWICEAQADAFARRYDGIRISSMRFHWVVPSREEAVIVQSTVREDEKAQDETPRNEAARHLWAYTIAEAAADACLLALDAPFRGHETFYIAAPDTISTMPTLETIDRLFPEVPIHGDLSGFRSFFSSAKAERLLGWKHPPGQ